jgi:hypothetical protein
VRDAPDSIRALATAKCPKCKALCKLLHPDSPSYKKRNKLNQYSKSGPSKTETKQNNRKGKKKENVTWEIVS